MKIVLITAAVIVVLVLIAQFGIARATSNTEEHAYEVLKDFGEFEIRKYEPAIFSYTVMPAGSYKENSTKGFRILAGYIFGGNDQNKKIAMTTPVEMDMSDSIIMKFKVPNAYKLEDLPEPNDTNVKFVKEDEKTVAAIRFGGWATDERIEEYSQKLLELLDSNNISHAQTYSFYGYNPPYEMVNRRNEVIVEVLSYP